MKKLSQLNVGEQSTITHVDSDFSFLIDRGFFPDEVVSVISLSPQKDKLVVSVLGSIWVLEKDICEKVFIK